MGDHRRRREDDWFGFDIDDEFERMRKRMERMIEDMMSGERATQEKPFVYGFSMRAGPDGKPQIREFGNTAPHEPERGVPEVEPLTDIIERDDSISITVEIPGVEKDDIDLDVSGDKLSISVDADDRKYFKELPLPSRIVSDSVKATYKNGVLDIVLEKDKARKGKKVKID